MKKIRVIGNTTVQLLVVLALFTHAAGIYAQGCPVDDIKKALKGEGVLLVDVVVNPLTTWDCFKESVCPRGEDVCTSAARSVFLQFRNLAMIRMMRTVVAQIPAAISPGTKGTSIATLLGGENKLDQQEAIIAGITDQISDLEAYTSLQAGLSLQHLRSQAGFNPELKGVAAQPATQTATATTR